MLGFIPTLHKLEVVVHRCTAVIPGTERWRVEKRKFKVITNYTVSSRLVLRLLGEKGI